MNQLLFSTFLSSVGIVFLFLIIFLVVLKFLGVSKNNLTKERSSTIMIIVSAIIGTMVFENFKNVGFVRNELYLYSIVTAFILLLISYYVIKKIA